MRISWITIGRVFRRADGTATSDLASLRYRVLSPIQAMGQKRHIHRVAQMTPESAQETADRVLNADMLIFSKSHLAANETLAARARALGIPTIFDVCDNHFQNGQLGEHYKRLAGLVDQVICNTAEMAKVARPYAKSEPIVIEDPYEGPKGAPKALGGERLELLWFGHPSNLDSLAQSIEDLAGFAQRTPLSLTALTQLSDGVRTFHRSMEATVAGRYDLSFAPWSLERQWQALADCDAVILPSLNNDVKHAKSANRMIEALWAGRPVAAQPIPAYLPFAPWAAVRNTISDGLEQLVSTRLELPGLITAAQTYIETRYAPAILGRAWEKAIMDLSASRSART